MSDIARVGDVDREVRGNLQMEIENDEFNIGQAVLFVASEVTLDVIAMLFLNTMTTIANIQIGRLKMSCRHLERA